MRMRKCLFFILFCGAVSVLFGTTTHAIGAEEPPVPYYSSVFVTALQTDSDLDFIELHNEASDPIDMSSWTVEVTGLTNGVATICDIQLGDWLLPNSYVVLAKGGVLSDATGNVRTYTPCTPGMQSVAKLDLLQGTNVQEELTPNIGAFVRKGETKTYRTGIFSKDFVPMTAPNRTMVYANAWYAPPMTAPLQVSEVLANARDCSPLETSLDCSDYVKLYNPTDQQIDLAAYRLRSGFSGQSSSAGNTYALQGSVSPGHFAVITSSADARSLNLTNSGGYVWLEDAEGITTYPSTVQAYADASSDTRKGQAWAYDMSDATWKWTTQPTPADSPSVFPLPSPAAAKAAATTSLTPCKEGQYRSEETNRCRSLATAVTALASCDEDQERNPATGRCRKLASAASQQLTPCKEGQERNLETNRCRNVVANVPATDFAVQPIAETGGAFVGWWAVGGVGTLAIGYGVWEWRHEFLATIRKIGLFASGRK